MLFHYSVFLRFLLYINRLFGWIANFGLDKSCIDGVYFCRCFCGCFKPPLHLPIIFFYSGKIVAYLSCIVVDIRLFIYRLKTHFKRSICLSISVTASIIIDKSTPCTFDMPASCSFCFLNSLFFFYFLYCSHLMIF